VTSFPLINTSEVLLLSFCFPVISFGIFHVLFESFLNLRLIQWHSNFVYGAFFNLLYKFRYLIKSIDALLSLSLPRLFLNVFSLITDDFSGDGVIQRSLIIFIYGILRVLFRGKPIQGIINSVC